MIKCEAPLANHCTCKVVLQSKLNTFGNVKNSNWNMEFYEYFSSPRSSEFIQWLLCGLKSDSVLSLSPNNIRKNQPHSWEERVNF